MEPTPARASAPPFVIGQILRHPWEVGKFYGEDRKVPCMLCSETFVRRKLASEN